jgi:hypothetical protein
MKVNLLPPRRMLFDDLALWTCGGTLDRIRRAIDGESKPNGRPRLYAIVHPADIQDRDGGMRVVSTLFGRHPFLQKLFADGGDQGPEFKRLWPKRFCPSRSKSSNGRIAPKDSRFSHGVGPSMVRHARHAGAFAGSAFATPANFV